MDKSRKGVVSYHQLCELVYDEEAAAQVRPRLRQPAPPYINTGSSPLSARCCPLTFSHSSSQLLPSRCKVKIRQL